MNDEFAKTIKPGFVESYCRILLSLCRASECHDVGSTTVFTPCTPSFFQAVQWLHFIYLPGARSLLKVRLSQKMKALHHLALPALCPIWLWSKQWTFNTLDILSYKKLIWIGVQSVCHGAILAMTGTIANPSKRMLIGDIDHSLSELKLLDCSSHSLCWSLRQEGMEWNMDVRERQLAWNFLVHRLHPYFTSVPPFLGARVHTSLM